MFSCSCIMKMLTSSLVTLNMKHAFILRFLAAGVPPFTHLLNFARSRRDLPLSQEIP